MLDRHAERLLLMLSVAGGEPCSAPRAVADRRRALESLAQMAGGGSPDDVAASTIAVLTPAGALNARLYVPLSVEEPGPGIAFFHGGGWVAGSLDTHDGVCGRLAIASGCRVLAVDYRLAPEHPFPAAIDDAVATLRWMAASAPDLNIDPARLVVAGDSVGAGLAASVACIARDQSGPSIALQVLICPILDVAHRSASRRAFAQGYFLDEATLAADLADYVPSGTDLADPRLSPLLAQSVAGLPPAIIHSAQFDPFTDEAGAYAGRLTEAGVPVRHTQHPGMIHYFYAMPRAIPHAAVALAAIGDEIRRALERA